MWKWVGENEKQIKIVFTLIAAVYVVFSYQKKVEQDRIANSMDFVHRYADGKILDARDRLDAFWLSDSVGNETRLLQAEPNPKIRIPLYHKIITHLLRKNGNDRDVYKILQFYRNVSLCVEADRCDQNTVCNCFFADMQSFRENYLTLLDDWKKNLGETAPGDLSVFVQKKCGDTFEQYCKTMPTSPYCKNIESKAN